MSDTEMIMGDAGKAMPVPRGRYSDTETYDYLDFVYSGDASYIAKKLTTGNPPAEDNEYWQLLARGGTLTENSDVSNTTVTFEEAKSRINIFSKDSLSVIMGKIKKWLSDLKPVATSGKYEDLDGRLTVTNNDLANVPGTAWDAVRGAAIRKDVDKINSDLSTKALTSTAVINQFPANPGVYTIGSDLEIPGFNNSDGTPIKNIVGTLVIIGAKEVPGERIYIFNNRRFGSDLYYTVSNNVTNETKWRAISNKIYGTT